MTLICTLKKVFFRKKGYLDNLIKEKAEKALRLIPMAFD